jgi:hypothetical protein
VDSVLACRYEEITVQSDLIYNIATGLITGSVGGHSILAHCGSGGRAGTKTPGALNWWLANNPFATHVQKTQLNPGGPIPYGKYKLVLHESRKNWIRLIPLDPRTLQGRSGFAIHGRGQRGSDGCIVPTDFHIVQFLCQLLHKLQKKGQPAPVLEVVATGQDLDQKLRTA